MKKKIKRDFNNVKTIPHCTCGIQKLNKVIMPCVISEAEEANAVPREPYSRTVRSGRRALATSMAHHHKRSDCRGRVAERRLVLTCLKGWYLPPHLMHPTKSLGHIYVEKSPEQCCLGCRNSQKIWEGV